MMPPVPEDIFVKAVKDFVLANAAWVPPFGQVWSPHIYMCINIKIFLVYVHTEVFCDVYAYTHTCTVCMHTCIFTWCMYMYMYMRV